MIDCYNYDHHYWEWDTKNYNEWIKCELEHYMFPDECPDFKEFE